MSTEEDLEILVSEDLQILVLRSDKHFKCGVTRRRCGTYRTAGMPPKAYQGGLYRLYGAEEILMY